TRKTLAAALAALALTAACAEAPSPTATARVAHGPSRIVNGSPTGGAYANVGALLFDYGHDGITGDDEWCTGSLIAPDVFLTAAHCVVTEYTPPGSQFYVSFSADLFGKGFKSIAATSYVWDPQYGQDQANLHDLALVFLPKGSTKGMTPLQLPPAGYLDRLSAQGGLNNAVFVNVGYGVSANRTGVPQFDFDGKRSYSKSPFMGLQPTWLGLLMNTSATGLGGDCYGDSGGPKFLDGNPNMILATVTTGDYNCRATTWDWRLDSPEARGFLGKYLPLP
ncbi:MAG TPA: trypsin-like serine protease, partial [Acidobacteriaceae bacterium]|nr:trypsin-like serine protease [Acidobacteriaceae bacterium]